MAYSLKSHYQGGATLLEMAIALPVLLILLMGTIDLGRAIDSYLSITRSAYEGIRFAARQSNNKASCIGKEWLDVKVPDPKEPGKLKSAGCIEYITANYDHSVYKSYNIIDKILRKKDIKNALISIKIENKSDTVIGPDGKAISIKYKEISTAIEAPLESLLPFFRIFPIKAHMTFSDLYQDT